MTPLFLSTALLLISTPASYAQSPARDLRTHADWPAASAADSSSPNAVVEAFFQSISAPQGGKLDQNRLNSLFLPSGRIAIPIPATNSGSKTDIVFLTPSQYAENSDAFTAKQGFFDRTLALHIQRFGVIAHVFASYASRNAPSDKTPFQRGIKSFELIESGSRWYIAQVSWDNEREHLTIPETFLQNRNEP